MPARPFFRSLFLSFTLALIIFSVTRAGEETAAMVRGAHAEEGVQATIVKSFVQSHDERSYTARLEIIGTPRSRLFLLANPGRIALDMFDTVSAVQQPAVEGNPLVAELRQGLVASDRYRLVFSLKRPSLPKAEIQKLDGRQYLVLTITESDERAFAQALKTQLTIEPATVPGVLAPNVLAPNVSARTTTDNGRRFTVVIDPGHGGIDNGAQGPGGTLEKDVNLKFAKALRDAMAGDPTVDVVLTREDDRFIPLDERAAIGRRAGADIFISCHADSIRYGDLRGATVYTLSERASDSLALEIADSENAADRFVGPDWRKNAPEVIDILADLTRRETESFSEHFAAILIDELGRHDIRLMKNPKRSAGFRVLMASDIPSVLVEMGYLSNADDEKLLGNDRWRGDTASAIASAVLTFLKSRDGSGKRDGG